MLKLHRPSKHLSIVIAKAVVTQLVSMNEVHPFWIITRRLRCYSMTR